jgi:superfamily I DNA/RNA helicase
VGKGSHGYRLSAAVHRETRRRLNPLKVILARCAEFPVMAIPGAAIPFTKNEKGREELRLLYVAMTRALDHLIVGMAA